MGYGNGVACGWVGGSGAPCIDVSSMLYGGGLAGVDTHSYSSGHMLMRVTGLQEGERKNKNQRKRGGVGRREEQIVFRVRGFTIWKAKPHIRTWRCAR